MQKIYFQKNHKTNYRRETQEKLTLTELQVGTNTAYREGNYCPYSTHKFEVISITY